MLETDNYEKFKKDILQLAGIDLNSYKEKQMRRRINTTTHLFFLVRIQINSGKLQNVLFKFFIIIGFQHNLLSSCFLLHKSSVKPDLLSCHIKNRLYTFRESLFLSILLYTEFSSLLLQLHRYRHLQHQHLLTHLSPEQVML